MASAAAKPPAETAFDECLTAFNSNDKAALTVFNERRFGEANHNIDYLLDSREETGGLEVVQVELSKPTVFVALTQERNFPAFRRITVKVDKPGSPRLDYVIQEPQRMPQAQALEAFDAFATRMAAADRFSGVLVVEQNGKRLYGKHFGLAGRENNTPVRLETPFLFASQGKMFTAVSVLQLIEAGKVGFDDPIGKYLTDYPNEEMAKVTIRQLLSHQGGTGDIGVLQLDEGPNRAWAHHRRPDQAQRRSCSGISAGVKIRVFELRFRTARRAGREGQRAELLCLCRRACLRSGRDDGNELPDPGAMADVARGYMQGDNGTLIPSADQLPWRGSPAGGDVSAADDEVRFVEALKAGKLISLPMLTEEIKQQTDWYGYGLISSGPTEFPHWDHGGGARGNSAELSVYPNNMTMVCLRNRDPSVYDRLLTRLHFHLSPPPPDPAEAAAN